MLLASISAGLSPFRSVNHVRFDRLLFLASLNRKNFLLLYYSRVEVVCLIDCDIFFSFLDKHLSFIFLDYPNNQKWIKRLLPVNFPIAIFWRYILSFIFKRCVFLLGPAGKRFLLQGGISSSRYIPSSFERKKEKTRRAPLSSISFLLLLLLILPTCSLCFVAFFPLDAPPRDRNDCLTCKSNRIFNFSQEPVAPRQAQVVSAWLGRKNKTKSWQCRFESLIALDDDDAVLFRSIRKEKQKKPPPFKVVASRMSTFLVDSFCCD